MPMTKRPLKRLVREGGFDERQFEDDAKIRRLPTARAWTPLPHNDDREQGYLKTNKAKAVGQQRLIAAGDPNQADLLPELSGLATVADRLEALSNIAVVRLADQEIVRHPLVADMLGVL